MGFFLQILVSSVATVNCIVSHTRRVSDVRRCFAFFPASWNALVLSCLTSLAFVFAGAEFTFDLYQDRKDMSSSISSWLTFSDLQ
jgi:hypothetical protein